MKHDKEKIYSIVMNLTLLSLSIMLNGCSIMGLRFSNISDAFIGNTDSAESINFDITLDDSLSGAKSLHLSWSSKKIADSESSDVYTYPPEYVVLESSTGEHSDYAQVGTAPQTFSADGTYHIKPSIILTQVDRSINHWYRIYCVISDSSKSVTTFVSTPFFVPAVAVGIIFGTYSVQYMSVLPESGTVPEDQGIYKTGETLTVCGNTGNLIREKYRFDGWNTAEDGTGITYVEGDKIAMKEGGLTLYALWTLRETFSLSFDTQEADSGTVPQKITVFSGDTISYIITTTDIELQKAGFVFQGWSFSNDGSEQVYTEGTKFIIRSDTVLYAIWDKILSLKYHSNETGTDLLYTDPNQYFEGESYYFNVNPGEFTVQGLEIKSWNTKPDGTGTDYPAGSTILFSESDLELYAQWVQKPYLLSLNANGATGTAPLSPAGSLNEKISIPGKGDLARTGKIFVGWNTKPDGLGGNWMPGDIYVFTKSETLYAVWR